MTKKHLNWFGTLLEQYQSSVSNAFFITGNTSDYVEPGINIIDFLKGQFLEYSTSFTTYNYSEELTYFKRSVEENKNMTGSWNDLLALLRFENEKNVVIIEYPEYLIPESFNGNLDNAVKSKLIDLQKILNNKKFIHSDNLLIFVSEARSSVHQSFFRGSARVSLLNIDFPNENERLEMINYLVETSTAQMEWEVTKAELARITAGLTKVHLEDLMLIAEHEGVFRRSFVIEQKEELIRKEFGEIIETFDAEGLTLDDFAGQEHIKAYHKESIITPMQLGETEQIPKGLLYMGPPGTGKTYFAQCLSGESGINFVEFKMSKILDKWVGEAERNLEKAFNCFKSLAPVGVFIDEIDQVLSRGEDSGNNVHRSLFGMFLSFLSDPKNRGEILWIGATNYPNKIDEALKRAGRFDKKLPFFPPKKEERFKVFEHHLNKSQITFNISTLDKLADDTDGYTPAEIENIVVKATELAYRRRLNHIDEPLLFEAKKYMLKQTNSKINEMIRYALEDCNDLEFVPKEYLREMSPKD